MSRIRTIKPELFRHEELFDAELESGLPLRLAFMGLFTVADCEGRFVWKPRTLKLDVLPHDTVDFAAVLNALAATGFIQRYEVAGHVYGLIPSFTKHQIINIREKERGSDIPPPCSPDPAQPYTVPEPSQHSTGTVPEPSQHSTGTKPELQEEEEEQEREEERKPPQEERAAETLAGALARARGEGGRKKLNGAPMTADWFPSDAAYTVLVGLGIPRTFGEVCIPEFRLYWMERGDARPGWDASFVNSVKRTWDKRPKGDPPKVMGQRRPGQTIAERITEEHTLLFGKEPDPFSFLPKPKTVVETGQVIEGEVTRVN